MRIDKVLHSLGLRLDIFTLNEKINIENVVMNTMRIFHTSDGSIIELNYCEWNKKVDEHLKTAIKLKLRQKWGEI